jgi:hypothetical protein
MGFNLLEDGFIPVVWADGRADPNSYRVGIRQALTEAGRIRQIAASNPMDNVALVRFLLAVLQWCRPEAEQDELGPLCRERPVGIPPDWVEGKFGAHRDDFELLDQTQGFGQDAGVKGNKVAASNLLHDLPSASNVAHFRHTRDFREGVCPACCAMGLVRWSAYASAGTAGSGESMTAGIHGNTPAYSLPEGHCLLETLRLNWPMAGQPEGDAPLWDGATEESPLGPLKAFTWRTRRVFLAPPDPEGQRGFSSGRCCYCGEQSGFLVQTVIFRPGWRRPGEPWADPHLLKVVQPTRTKAGKAKPKETIPSWPSPDDPLEEHSAVWRGIMNGLLQRSPGSCGEPPKLRSVLVGANQQLYKHVGESSYAWPGELSRHSSRLREELDWLRQVIWITVATRGEKKAWSKPPKGHILVESLRGARAKGQAIRAALSDGSPTFEKELELAFLDLLRALAGEVGEASSIDQHVDQWRDKATTALRRAAREAVRSTLTNGPLSRLVWLDRAGQAVEDAIRQVRDRQPKETGQGTGDHAERTAHAAAGAQGKAKPRRARKRGGAE